MADSYTGEIRIFAGTYAPVDWMLCDGQILSISSYEFLYTIIGTRYGGDGVSTFALPDMRGRMPIHRGQRPGASMFVQGIAGGAEAVALTSSNLPSHTHAVYASSNAGDAASPSGATWAPYTEGFEYSDQAPNTAMHASAVNSSGTGTAHSNVSPYLCLNFIICVNGYYPSPA